jgi:hypothetical protein
MFFMEELFGAIAGAMALFIGTGAGIGVCWGAASVAAYHS